MGTATTHANGEAAPERGTSPERNALGVSACGDALRSATALGAVLVVGALVLCAAYLALLRAPGDRAGLVEVVAASHASEQIGRASV